MNLTLADETYDDLKRQLKAGLRETLFRISTTDYDDKAKMKIEMIEAWTKYRVGIGKSREIRDFLKQQGDDVG